MQPIWDREAAFYGATMLPCLGAVVCSMTAASLMALKKPEQVPLEAHRTVHTVVLLYVLLHRTYSI